MFAVEQVKTEDNKLFHRGCLRCKECSMQLTVSNFSCVDGVLYCRAHHQQLFKLKGNYNEGFGSTQRKNEFPA